MSIFNNQQTLDVAIRSILPYVGGVVVVDGSWEGEPSKDESKEIATRFPKVLWMEAKPWGDQNKKRKAYFIGEPGDSYFVLDGDERLLCGGKWFTQLGGDRCYYVTILELSGDTYFHPRIHKHCCNNIHNQPISPLPIMIQHLRLTPRVKVN